MRSAGQTLRRLIVPVGVLSALINTTPIVAMLIPAVKELQQTRGIPARLGFADVRNHLSTERMRQVMGTDIFYWHGFTEIHLDGRWVKATPAFNIELCDKFGLLPLEFDGHADSIYHRFDRAGHRHMEYVAERGSYDDVPLARIIADFRAGYPVWEQAVAEGGDFATDVDAEVGG